MGGNTTWRGSHRHDPVITFHPFDGPAIDASAHCTLVQTQKSIGQPAGTWSMRLKRRVLRRDNGKTVSVDWLDALSAGDWVHIGFKGADGITPTMLGVVDSVRRHRRAGTAGNVMEIFTVSGRDFAAAYTDSQIITIPGAEFNPLTEEVLFVDALRVLSEATSQTDLDPFSVVKALATLLMRGGVLRGAAGVLHWKIPSSVPYGRDSTADVQLDAEGSFSFDTASAAVRRQLAGLAISDLQLADIVQVVGNNLDPSNTPALRGRLTIDELALNGRVDGQRVHDILQGYANGILNELFFDLRPDASAPGKVRPSLVIRERPFPYQDVGGRDLWRRLETHTIDERDFIDEDLGKSGHQRLNLFLSLSAAYSGGDVYTAAISEAADGGLDEDSAPAFLRESVERHGFRFYQANSRYLDLSANPLAHEEWTHIHRDWFRDNHEMLSGTVQAAHLRPHMRIGEKLRVQRVNGDYHMLYIEGVAHTWQAVGSTGEVRSETTLTLTRGTRNSDGAVFTFVDISDVEDDEEVTP